MHREQTKCNLRRQATFAQAQTVPKEFSNFSANLHSAKLNLLPHMVLTAVMDACRSVAGAASGGRATRRKL